LISETNLADVAAAGFDHVIATRLHRDPDVAAVLEAADSDDIEWVRVTGGRTACEILHDGRRHVVVDSPPRRRRDDGRREELLARTEDQLIGLDRRVRAGRLVDPPPSVPPPNASSAPPRCHAVSPPPSARAVSDGTTTNKPSTTNNASSPAGMC
jgi:hypothetical protein